MTKHRFLTGYTQKAGNSKTYINPIALKRTPEQIELSNEAWIQYKRGDITMKEYYLIVNKK